MMILAWIYVLNMGLIANTAWLNSALNIFVCYLSSEVKKRLDTADVQKKRFSYIRSWQQIEQLSSQPSPSIIRLPSSLNKFHWIVSLKAKVTLLPITLPLLICGNGMPLTSINAVWYFPGDIDRASMKCSRDSIFIFINIHFDDLKLYIIEIFISNRRY